MTINFLLTKEIKQKTQIIEKINQATPFVAMMTLVYFISNIG